MKSYRILPPDLATRAYLNVSFDEAPDARMLGCKWDKARQNWWIDRASVARTAYVWRWLDVDDPMRKAARKAYLHLERQNAKEVKTRNRRGGKHGHYQ